MYDLSKPQKSIYNMEKFAGGAIANICCSMLRVGSMDGGALQDAVNALYRLNDALRTRIIETSEGTRQLILEYGKQDFETLTFENQEKFSNYARIFAKRPMDLYGLLCEIKIVFVGNKYGILVKLHHIIGDAWTMALLARQFATLLDGKTPEAYSYVEYLESEKLYIRSERYQKDKRFFLGQFQKCDEVTYLSEIQSNDYTAGRKTIRLTVEQTAQINAMAQENDSSMFAVLMTLFATCFSHIKMNVEKFYIGSPILNRAGIKERNTAGMFINTVPFLAEMDNEKTFCENLQITTGNIMSLLRHQHYNYEQLLSELRREYGFNEKLYDVILSYQNAETGTKKFQSQWHSYGMQTESLQIHIDDHDGESMLTINYDYRTVMFTETEIECMHEYMIRLFADAIKNPNRKICELDILSSEEKSTLLYAFNNTKRDYPKNKCLHQLFEEQVKRTPDKTAVIACDKTLTYDELNKLSNRIANRLIKKGIGKGDIIAFAVPRRSYLIATLFGILKSGAAYMPIDPDYPQDRIDYMLADSNAKLFITKENFGDYISDNEENPDVEMASESYCYCIYTSGSTGKPKGTILHHKGIVNLVKNLTIYGNVSEIHTIGFLTTITFDVATQEILTALLNGFVGVLLPERRETTVGEIIDYIENYNIDMIYSTPSYFDALTSEYNNTERLLKRLSTVVLAGEKFYLNANAFELGERYHVIFENQYGPAETHVITTNTIRQLKNLSGNDMHIGKPISNTQIYIVDKYNNILPIGYTGELCIAGDGVGAGYLNRVELTAEKFIDNPFGDGKLYKTGDLAYWHGDGNIVFIGRNDFQVKIRGLRIELGEIENAICSMDGVLQAVVVVRKAESGRQFICAFYTEKSMVDIADIKRTIQSRLPRYMLPHIFTKLDKMPLTSSGKINRKALPEIDLRNFSNEVEYVEPKTEEEKLLVFEIGQILFLNKISLLDNFFDIGGDSLKAIELLSKLETHGFSTTVKNIFDSKDIKMLAKKLEKTEEAKDFSDYRGDIPATPAQIRVYTAQSMNANSTTYNVPYVFKVKELNIDKLQMAVDKMMERHEILRTHFENKDGQIVQIIKEKVVCKIEYLRNDEISAFIRPFNLSSTPLIRVGYYKNTIMLDMHHIITDGGSVPVFLNELNDLYMGRELNSAPIQYKQFSVEKQDYTEFQKYWLSVYNDELPELGINTDFPRGQKQSFNGNAIYDMIEMVLHGKIIDKCKNLRITPFVFYMSAFNILLSKFSGDEDVVIGVPVSGRKDKYLSTLGMFVNTIVLRNKPIGNKKVSEFVQEVKVNTVNAIVNQDYPFGELVRELEIDTQNRNPLFDVMFAYQSEEMTKVMFGDEPVELLPIPITTSKYDFTFNIMPRENDVVIMVEYCTDLYSEKTIDRLIDAYKRILEVMLDETRLICDISAISKEEENKILHEFNDVKADYSRDKCVHQLFEEQVKKTPDKMAVVACDENLTYNELNKLSNRIANALIEKGIGKGDIVAFALSRRSYLIAAMFGILKSGAAYMPIDPDYPKDRIDYILVDSNAKVFVTDDNIYEYTSDIEQNPNVEITSESYCYCIYTSGSTGNPKGTLLHHRGIVNLVTNPDIYKDLSKCKIFGFLTTITFDVATQEILTALLNGFTGCLMPERSKSSVEEISDGIVKNEIDIIYGTPSYFDMLMSTTENAKKILSRLKVMVLAGEKFYLNNIVKGLRNTYETIFENQYGPVELHVIAASTTVEDDDFANIGRPIANNAAYIVDKYSHILPIGVTGELCIAGDGVGAGYLNRPELTAEKFIDNPFGGGKLYKTGDLAYWREDGNLVFVGRNDFQVKIRGLRIELGEIESAICSVDGISQAVVVVRKDESGRQLICAFYTEKSAVDVSEIKRNILEKLPKYMLPHIFSRLDEMPLTSSGKINRKALPEVDLSPISSVADYVKPRTKLQKELARLMEQVLDYAPIGLKEDFFDCSGDSLKAIEFVSKAHGEGIYFNMQAIFDHPTTEGLCEYIENGDKVEDSYVENDFRGLHEIISNNVVSDTYAVCKMELGNVFLTGATGYLGIHILAEFLESENGKIYCLVRGKDREDGKDRLRKLLDFYFDGKYVSMFDSRIIVINGDLISDDFGLEKMQYDSIADDVHTIIHAAASVKHYGSYKYFYDINVEGTRRVVCFTRQANANLIHVSTLSVSGNSLGDNFDTYRSVDEKLFGENSLFIGQELDNVYIRSKFEAEKMVIEAMAGGLHANICRMGNLTNRYSDCKFQYNYESNAFVQRVKALLELGAFPDYLLSLYAEFTPVDDAARAVMTIAKHFNMNYNVFHVNNHKVVYFDKLLKYFENIGIGMEVVGDKDFSRRLRNMVEQSGREYIFETFINDMTEEEHLNYDSNIRILNDFTVDYLMALGFEWSDVGMDYVKKYIDYFKKIGYIFSNDNKQI